VDSSPAACLNGRAAKPLLERYYDRSVAIQIDLSDRRALVTGSGAGIGREIARWLARAGATVVVHDIRAEKADTVAREIRAAGGAAHAVIADARDDEALVAMVDDAVVTLGGLDIAVNNVGMYAGQRPGPFATLDVAHWRELIDQNLVSLHWPGRRRHAP
jgi:NAD(P)-dependent dehydrogenase (short-subunit alcohol dehydrogenase family)